MNTGALRQLVTLDVPDGATGGFLPLDPPEWYCAAIDASGAGGTVLVGHYHPGISTSTRVHLKGRVFHVDEVRSRDERDIELIVTCHEVYA